MVAVVALLIFQMTVQLMKTTTWLQEVTLDFNCSHSIFCLTSMKNRIERKNSLLLFWILTEKHRSMSDLQDKVDGYLQKVTIVYSA